MERVPFKTKLKRVIRAGFFNFWRSGYVSLASIMVMIVTLFVIGSVMFVSVILNTTMTELKNKIDINVYFVINTPEDEIFSLQKRIETLPEVQLVEYVSREETLAKFRLKHENDQLTLQALDELGDNPFGASLNIRARDPSNYESIANFLNEEDILASDGKKIIDQNTYFKTENRTAIDRLSRLINSVESLGFGLSIILVVVSVVITFNTIRLAIYISREEISVMQLVGASKNYIKGPFVVTGVIVGLLSAIITLSIFFPALYFIGGKTANFFIGLNIFDYYQANFFQIAFILLGSGIGIGALSSFLAVRRYLKL